MSTAHQWAMALAAGSMMGLAQAATSLSGAFTADDNLKIYLAPSLDPASFQLVYNKTSSWGSTESMAGVALSGAGQPLYLLIEATNNSGPAMWLAEFTLQGDDYRFANGGAQLFSDITHWRVGEQDFASASAAPVSMGQNLPGLPIWGQRPGISPDALAIWAYNADWTNGRPGTVYFVTQLSPVPEPGSWALFGVGLLALTRRSTRSR